MKLHPLLNNPNAVLIARTPVTDPVPWDDFRRAAHHILDAMQLAVEGEKVVVKPNGTVAEKFADPDTGITTHPGFVQGILEYAGAHGATRGRTFILEDPRNTDDNTPRHWRGTGYPEVAARTGAKLRTPKTYTCVKKPVPNPQAHAQLNISRLAVAPDTLLINVPKLKTHNLGITTLCLKNLMGTVNVFDRHFCGQAWQELKDERGDTPARDAGLSRDLHAKWQHGLARRLADLGQVVQPQINIVEGIVGRDGTGFQNGTNHALGLAIAGVNMVAVDSITSYLMGYDPQALIYLQVAASVGLGTNDVRELSVYVVHDGDIAPCADLDAWRTDPPLRVISNISDGDDKDLFNSFL